MFYNANTADPRVTLGLDIADKAIKALALMVGAAWAGFNFLKSRTYAARVECAVTAEFFSKDDHYYILAHCQLKNTGLARYTIEQEGTYLEAVTVAPEGDIDLPPAEVFLEDKWLEPGDQISDPIVLKVADPSSYVALRLRLRVVSKKKIWTARCVLIASNAKSEMEKTDELPKERFEHVGDDHEGKRSLS